MSDMMSDKMAVQARTIEQLGRYRDRAFDLMNSITEQMRELSSVMMYMQRDIAWLEQNPPRPPQQERGSE